ncbi:branched-chain amino acid ABC transporter permease [Alcaligenes endophyticus]|uniref:Branched-chain amino acid ABC transporter permease n=1 Tax=Alcaligenes endophyticus TaxID=1929088 RepID=A0ABT8EMD3_9BURK|nr:branched-chain amino acid ABC transporter permease [Alcaligenes endophyticus]MCX5590962.1 branched-chain amino acid ABC transporter permease [Alcaligenes endophyticus]MDN4122461.1 branched-chain amino acid ABC transporter permease [Alcaligenes endophyticus]
MNAPQKALLTQGKLTGFGVKAALSILLLLGLFLLPMWGDIAVVLDLSVALILGLLALSMGLLWGYVGILSFGQTIFFGLAGYSYALLAMNGVEAVWAVLLAIIIPMLFAAVLGYFMIYGRLSDIYLSVITLVVTLLFEKTIRATSGPEYVVGTVRLNGQNGIPGVPGLDYQIGFWDMSSIEGVYWLALMSVAVMMLLSYMFLRSRKGRTLQGIRENELRMELLGYNTRRLMLLAFTLSSALAAIAGVLYVIWGNFVGPEMFSLNQAALVVIWVIVGGRMSLFGPLLGALLIQYLSTWLGTQGVGQVNIVLGAVLLFCVLLFPEGLVPFIQQQGRRLWPAGARA